MNTHIQSQTKRSVKMFRIGTLPTYVAHVCGCGRWDCMTQRGDEVQVKFTYCHEPDYYTVRCAAQVLAACADDIEWVRMTPATKERVLASRPVQLPILEAA